MLIIVVAKWVANVVSFHLIRLTGLACFSLFLLPSHPYKAEAMKKSGKDRFIILFLLAMGAMLCMSSCKTNYYFPGSNGKPRRAAKGCDCPTYAQKTDESESRMVALSEPLPVKEDVFLLPVL